MLRHFALIALALIAFSCAKEADKPITDNDDIPYRRVFEDISIDSAELRNREIKDSILALLLMVATRDESKSAGVNADNTQDRLYPKPGNIHLVAREYDTLVLATFDLRTDTSSDSYGETGAIDLIAATIKNGKIAVVDRKHDIANNARAFARPMNDYNVIRIGQGSALSIGGESSFIRLGKDVWGWVVDCPSIGHGFYDNYVTIYALMGDSIKELGSYLAASGNEGAFDDVYHSYASTVLVVDDHHPRVSDLAILWYHNFSDKDSSQRVTTHRYRPGKGYDFSSLPYERCTHDTIYRMLDQPK
jgi:hypothetical protein